jgi:hypothetical protein
MGSIVNGVACSASFLSEIVNGLFVVVTVDDQFTAFVNAWQLNDQSGEHLLLFFRISVLFDPKEQNSL